ncbi:Rha family transcriptional regulator [Paenibacillus sp. FSL W8-0426]|uniref:Rha family transcriptional regulator n=1 Tax=Paenibacillus sp. FSL W8-0426 TaxID=2921714 RepID=UPI0030D71520
MTVKLREEMNEVTIGQQWVFIDNGRVLTDSLTVARVFDKKHDHVLRDIRQQLSKLSEAGETEWGITNFGETPYTHPQNGQTYQKYVMTEDGFAIIAMSYVTPAAMKMKVRFIEQFKQMAAQLQQLSAPSYAIDDPIARAKRWIQEREEMERIETERLLLAEKVTEQAPKVEAFDTFISADGLQTMGDVAKSLGWGRNRLYAELRDRNILMSGNKPYQRFVNEGYFTVKQTVKGNDEVKFTLPVTMVTARGVAYIERLLAS